VNPIRLKLHLRAVTFPFDILTWI